MLPHRRMLEALYWLSNKGFVFHISSQTRGLYFLSQLKQGVCISYPLSNQEFIILITFQTRGLYFLVSLKQGVCSSYPLSNKGLVILITFRTRVCYPNHPSNMQYVLPPIKQGFFLSPFIKGDINSQTRGLYNCYQISNKGLAY